MSSSVRHFEMFDLFKEFRIVYKISCQTFFVQAFKIVLDSWKFNML